MRDIDREKRKIGEMKRCGGRGERDRQAHRQADRDRDKERQREKGEKDSKRD